MIHCDGKSPTSSRSTRLRCLSGEKEQVRRAFALHVLQKLVRPSFTRWAALNVIGRGVDCLYKGQRASNGRHGSDYVRQLEAQVDSLSKLLETQQTQSQAAPTDLDMHHDLAHDLAEQQIELPMANESIPKFNTAPTPSSSMRLPDEEVSGVNQHTRNMEFYGSSSSMALLSHVNSGNIGNTGNGTLLSNLHNPAFTPPETSRKAASTAIDDIPGRAGHFPQCRGFLDNYFLAVHYIHPILDKAEFFERCEALWTGGGELPPSFAALYYSVLSIGAIISPRDDEPLRGLDNLQWSRLLFKEATLRCSQLVMVTDLSMIQCYFFLAKVCQNEIMPHWAYMYVGMAVRTALAIGINRSSGPNTRKSSVQLRAESRTWWVLYSLETEMSFAMGRPDTLGADLYHNQRYPLIRDVDVGEPDQLEPPHCAIIKSMVDFSRIIRQVCLGVYLTEFNLDRTLDTAIQLEQTLNHWILALPEDIRPRLYVDMIPSLQDARAPRWVKRQRLVLTIRYHNLRILMFGTLLLRSTKEERMAVPASQEGIQKCLDSAKRTVEIIYETLQHNDFFRTWFYNTTYTVFAASIILVYLTREASKDASQPLHRLVGMAIDILELMNESVVAQEAAKMLRRAKEAVEQGPEVSAEVIEDSRLLNQYWGRLDLGTEDVDFDMMFHLSGYDNDGFLVPFEPQ